MKLTTNWHASWSKWTEHASPHAPHIRYRARKRELYVGRLHIATLCNSTLRPREPFFMYPIGQPKHTVRGATAFRVVRAFMRQLR